MPEPRGAFLIGALVVALALVAPAALADGDPASDYLITQSAFLSPYNGYVPKKEGDVLVGLLADAKAKGFTLKVAVILNRYDLGAVPILFNQPQRYAKFLGQEDFYFWKDELLVVMPKGYGISKVRGLPAADKTLIAKLAPPNTTRGDELVAAASRAVIALAARRGITLKPIGTTSGSSTNHDRVVIAAAVLVAGLLALSLRFVLRRRRAR